MPITNRAIREYLDWLKAGAEKARIKRVAKLFGLLNEPVDEKKGTPIPQVKLIGGEIERRKK